MAPDKWFMVYIGLPIIAHTAKCVDDWFLIIIRVYNEYYTSIMSVTRYQMDNKILPTPTQIEFLEREHQGGKPYCVKYFNRSKNTKSLQSI